VRPAGNFHPEWGYLVPMPSFRRTAGAALIAAAVGAASGVVAIVSLVARPGSNTYDKISVNALISHVPIGAAPAQAHANTAAAARPASAEKPSDAALPAIVATFSSNAAGRDGAGAPNGQARSTTVAATRERNLVPSKAVRAHHPRAASSVAKHFRHQRRFVRSFQASPQSSVADLNRPCCAWATPPIQRRMYGWWPLRAPEGSSKGMQQNWTQRNRPENYSAERSY
jgi:hypothetical protein